MPLEIVTIGGGIGLVPTFERIEISAGVKDAARSVQLHFPDTPGAPIIPSMFPQGALITVMAAGDLVFTGYVDRLMPKLTGKDYRVVVAARSKGCDAVDSSVDHTKPDYVGQTALQIAQDQDAFGVGFSADVSLDPVSRWRPNVGASLWDSLRPLVEDEGATMFGQPDGSIRITRAGETAQPQAGPIVEGMNLFEIEADFNQSGQHSTIKAHGQSYKGNGAASLEIEGEADNSNVTRNRPAHEHHDRETDSGRIQKRAKRRRDKEQGEGLRCTIKAVGWRDSGGMLYAPGNLVWVQSPSALLAQYMLIETVHYIQDGKREGTKATLSCVDPRAHGGQGGGVNKSGSAWDFDDAAATT